MNEFSVVVSESRVVMSESRVVVSEFRVVVSAFGVSLIVDNAIIRKSTVGISLDRECHPGMRQFLRDIRSVVNADLAVETVSWFYNCFTSFQTEELPVRKFDWALRAG